MYRSNARAPATSGRTARAGRLTPRSRGWHRGKAASGDRDARTCGLRTTSASIRTPKEDRYDAYWYRTDRDEGRLRVAWPQRGRRGGRQGREARGDLPRPADRSAGMDAHPHGPLRDEG